MNIQTRTRYLAYGLGAIMLATLPYAVMNHKIVWWAVATTGIVAGLLGERYADRRLTRTALGALVVFLMIVLVACADPHYTTDPGPSVPPKVVGMEWATHSTDPSECGLGIMADGGIALVNLWNVPAGLGIDWLAYGIAGIDGPPGYSIVDCWNISQENWHGAFNLYVQCYGQPVLKSTWTDFGAASVWVRIPFCSCNVACLGFANAITSFWRSHMLWCMFNILDPRCTIGSSSSAMATAQTDSGTLPPGFMAPQWNTNTPIPTG